MHIDNKNIYCFLVFILLDTEAIIKINKIELKMALA